MCKYEISEVKGFYFKHLKNGEKKINGFFEKCYMKITF